MFLLNRLVLSGLSRSTSSRILSQVSTNFSHPTMGSISGFGLSIETNRIQNPL